MAFRQRSIHSQNLPNRVAYQRTIEEIYWSHRIRINRIVEIAARISASLRLPLRPITAEASRQWRVRMNPCKVFWWTCALILLSSNITNSQIITPASGVTAHAHVNGGQDVLNSDGVSDIDIFTLTTPVVGNSSASAQASASYRSEPPASYLSAESTASSYTENRLQDPLHLSASGNSVVQLTYEASGGWLAADTDAANRIAADINLTSPGSLNVTFGQSYSSTEPPYAFPGAVFFLWNRDTNSTVYTQGWGPLYHTPALWAVGPFDSPTWNLAPGHYRVFAGSFGYTFNNNSILSLHSTVSTSFTFELQVQTAAPPLTIQMMRGASVNAFVNSEGGVNEALIPTSDDRFLDGQPSVREGLVADGVTPLLFKFEQSTARQASYTVRISDPRLTAHLHISQGGIWGGGNMVTFDGHTRTQFAYIDGLVPETLFAAGETGFVAALTLTKTQPPSDLVSQYFRVERPPIFLVHGYGSDGRTWSAEFEHALEAATPYGFIKRISYGVTGSSPFNYLNTTGRFSVLVPELDRVLKVEEDSLHHDWAFTRYDVIAHSQGGILTRLLCGQDFSAYTYKFKTIDNFNRGRFRRVITVGSPHNGSTLAYYASRLNLLHGLYGVIPTFLKLFKILQAKFDPFGQQIPPINSDAAAAVDPDARFHVIAATINGGDVTLNGPVEYAVFGMNKLSSHQPLYTRGEIVLRNGSDGVVDIQSQRAGNRGTPVTQMQGDIAHLMLGGPEIENYVFDTVTSETTEDQVGSTAATLLRRPVTNNFGAFQRPIPLDSERKAEIDAEIPFSLIIDLIRPGPFQRSATPGGINSYTFSFTPNPSEPLDGTANWYAEAFGPDGVTTDGLTVTLDASDSTRVTVDVDGLVRGDVALYLSYNSTNGHLIFGQPVLVVSIPPGANLTGIELHPNPIIATVGDIIGLEIWGRYSNGSTSQLFVQPQNSSFSSSNVNVASVESGTGLLRAAGVGLATITARYAGLTTQATVYSNTGPPVVTTNPANLAASFSATLNGSVDPHGLTTTIHFQYGTTTSYGHTTPMQTRTGNTVRPISAKISGLAASTTYHFRIAATNSAGTTYGADRTFTTLSAMGSPVVITNLATNVASFSATLNSSVDPHGLTTIVHFEYGTTTSYGQTTANQSKAGNTYQSVSANISGLSANTTYHFRIVATNSAGTRYGSDRTFTTLSATGPPVVITNPATSVASSSATLNGSVDPHGLTTNVHFQYGTTTSYGSTTANQSKTGNTYQNVIANISGLTASTRYHFRIVATNSAGTRYGSDRTFTTQ